MKQYDYSVFFLFRARALASWKARFRKYTCIFLELFRTLTNKT